MTDLKYLLLYLAIAAVLVWLANRKGMGGFRSWLDRMSSRSVGNLGEAKRIAMAGETKEVRSFAGRTIHRATIGVRLMSTALAIALALASAGMLIDDPSGLAASGDAGMVLAGIFALGVYYLGFIWSYRLIRQDQILKVPNMTFGHRDFELDRLIRIEDDGAYMLRLYFDDGRKAEILKYVEGRVALANELDRRVTRATAQTA